MSIGTLFGWLLCGLIVGLVARLLVPGPQRMGMIQTIALGIVGAMVGGMFLSIMMGVPQTFSLSNAWHGWIAAIIGGAVVLWGYGFLYPNPS